MAKLQSAGEARRNNTMARSYGANVSLSKTPGTFDPLQSCMARITCQQRMEGLSSERTFRV